MASDRTLAMRRTERDGGALPGYVAAFTGTDRRAHLSRPHRTLAEAVRYLEEDIPHAVGLVLQVTADGELIPVCRLDLYGNRQTYDRQ